MNEQEFVDYIYPVVKNVSYGRCRSKSMAQDVIQMTMMDLIIRFRNGQIDPSKNMKGYAWRAVCSKTRNFCLAEPKNEIGLEGMLIKSPNHHAFECEPNDPAPIEGIMNTEKSHTLENINYIKFMAKKISLQYHVEMEEIESVGVSESIRMEQAFDPTRGIPFIAYAGKSIKIHMIRMARKLRNFIEKNESLEVKEEVDSIDCQDFLTKHPGSCCEVEDCMQVIKNIFETLTKSEQEALAIRYMDHENERGISRQAVSKSAIRGIEKLRKGLGL